MTAAITHTFQRTHLAMMLKYSGISFISGAVNHGFFSGQRSLITAAIGVVLFVIGALMEHHSAAGEPSASLMKTLLLGALLSIGLGFFTGGLQHFPDSPARSSWVVPLGFVVSVVALIATLGSQWTKALSLYALLSSIVVTAASVGAWQYFAKHGTDMAHGGGHHGNAAPAPQRTGNASTQAFRSANDAMHKGMDIAFTGDADADFLAGMVPHHQGAIDMARVVLTHGKDLKIKALAEQIIAAQDKEIAQMKGWQGALPVQAAPSKAKSAHDHSKHAH